MSVQSFDHLGGALRTLGASESNIGSHPGPLLAAAGRRALGNVCECQNQNPAPEGVDNRSGVLCSGAPTKGDTTRADTQLTEQARNCDHDSSDPCSQAKKQQKITQAHRHVSRLPHFSRAGATLTFQEIAFVLVPDTWLINIAVKRPKVRSRRSCQRNSYKMESYFRVRTCLSFATARRLPSAAIPARYKRRRPGFHWSRVGKCSLPTMATPSRSFYQGVRVGLAACCGGGADGPADVLASETIRAMHLSRGCVQLHSSRVVSSRPEK